MAPPEPVTEFIVFAVEDSALLEDGGTAEGRAWRAVLGALRKAPGVVGVYLGAMVEGEGGVVVVIDWAAPFYATHARGNMTLSAALSALSTFSTAPLRRLRVPFPSRCDRNAILAMQQDIPLASPVTEVSVAFFDRLVGTERLKAFEGVVAGLTGVYAGEGGASGWASGWVGGGLPLKVAGAVGEGGGVGKVEGEGKGKAEGGDGLGDTEEEEAEMYKAYVSVLGWESVAQHYKFNETDAVKRNVGAIQAVGVREWEVWHVALRKVWDGGREGEH